MSKFKRADWIELALIFFWCTFLTNADSYISPYLLMGMIGMCGCVARASIGYSTGENTGKQEKILTNVYAAVLSAAVVLANYKLFAGLPDDIIDSCVKLAEAILIFGSGIVLFKEVLHGVAHLDSIKKDNQLLKNKKVVFWVLWAVLGLEDGLILFGAQYPGELSVDSISQMTQLLTHTYSNHHPYYHTQIIHAVVSLGLWLFGDINKAVAMYSLFSIVVMISCFMYAVKTVYEATNNTKLSLMVYLYYLLMPFHIIYSITMWKDVFFGAAVAGFAVACYRCLKLIGNSKINYIVLFITAVGMCLLRSNGWLAFFLSAIVFALLFGKKQKRLLVLFAVVLLSTYVLKHPVLKMLQVSQPDTIEALSIPVQQIARVIADGRELTEEQSRVLGSVVDLEKVPEEYDSGLSDPIKGLVREKADQDYLKEHAADLVKVYLQLGVKYPLEYIKAWIDQTRGYWNGGYSYWRWSGNVQENTLGIQRTMKIWQINTMLWGYLGAWESSPLLQIFLSIGLYVWCLLIASFRTLIRKNSEALFVTIPFLAVILTLLVATPVYAEFRYAYAVFCGFPFVLSVAFIEKVDTDVDACKKHL